MMTRVGGDKKCVPGLQQGYTKEKLYAVDCQAEFCVRLRTLFRGYYSIQDALRAEAMAAQYGYIDVINKAAPAKKRELGISGDGFAFTSVSRLINEMAKSI